MMNASRIVSANLSYVLQKNNKLQVSVWNYYLMERDQSKLFSETQRDLFHNHGFHIL